MLHIVHSNRLETLASHFAEVVSRQGLDPFKSEQVVVQNAGMGRWLSLHLAQQTGIAANLRYLFPAELTWELLRSVLDNVPERDPCSPKLLRWRLLEEFKQQTDRYQHDLGHYLRSGEDDQAWQLAKQIAAVFDGYLFFRPDWIKRWEKEPAHDWQERLWQNVIKHQNLDHWIRLQNRFIHQLESVAPDQLPSRISFFSVPALSPAYIELIAKVAEKTEIYFYVMNPSWQYWGDIESRKQKIKRELAAQAYVTVGNPLLASWGTQGRDFIENLRNVEPYPSETEAFSEATQDSLLHTLQIDILNLEGETDFPALTNTPTAEASSQPEIAPHAAQHDHSISIHACHAPMREVEVLYDQLLAALERDKTLTPADMVIMSPEIETYAPFIEAVFTNAQVNLPFSIADQRFSSAKNISAACLRLLELPQSKFSAEAAFALLEYQEVRERFGLDETQVQQCRDWVRAVNIRWGIDPQFRAQFAGQTTFEHTWVYGLDRLLLGYAMPGEQLFSGVLPYDDLEGSQADILERFQSYIHTLFPLSKWASLQQPLSEWCEKLRLTLIRLFAEEADTYKVFQALDALNETAQQAEFTGTVAWSVFRDALRSQLEQNNQADGFLGSGITFCTLMPMRSVPFKFVGLLGMQDGGFPRQDTRISFDKLAQAQRRRGDRSRRDEDRYLFLESVLSARDTLYISYIGQSLLDNTPIMPSVLVSELLDYLEKRSGCDPDSFITRHPLQSFSQRYFKGNQAGSEQSKPLFSYRQDLAQLQQQVHTLQQREHLPFMHEQVRIEPNEAWRSIDLSTLIRFYRQPARYFLNQVLDISVYEHAETLAEREPFILESFVDSEISRQALYHMDQDWQPANTEKLLRAQGLLPHGTPGQLLFERYYAQAQQLNSQLPDITETQDFHLHLTVDDLTLQSELKNITPQGRIVLLTGYSGAWQWLEIWLQHLALNSGATIPQDWLRQTLIYTPEQNYQLAALDQAEAKQQLTALLRGYWQGLQWPLPFFPKSAWVMFSKRTPTIKAALDEWLGNDQHMGEGSKAEYALLYRGQSPLHNDRDGAAFMQWAQQLFGNMLQVRSEL